MCGLAGFVFHEGASPRREILRAMGRKMIHRGPDDEGIFVHNNVGLVHRRLSIIDLDTGKNPVFNEDRSVCAMLNGEIYNFKAIRQELRTKGHIFSTQGDTEVLVHLYEEYGQDFIHKLNGMFVFVIYDLSNNRLMIARDRIGQKPLYYYSDQQFFAFASELDALEVVPEIAFELDEFSAAMFFRYQYVPAPLSIYKNVFKLDPASVLLLENGHLSCEKYWHLAVQDNQLDERTNQEIDLQFNTLLEQSIDHRMISDVPLGGFLSGGIDSTAICHGMNNIASESIHTFSIGFESGSFNESDYAAEVAANLRTCHYSHSIGEFPSADIGKILSYFGEPFADASAIPTYYLCKMAREHVTVALSGDGADELLGGYNRYQAAFWAAHLAKLPKGLTPTNMSRWMNWLPESHGYYGRSIVKKLKHTARMVDNLVDTDFLTSPRIYTRREYEALLPPDLINSGEDPVARRDSVAPGHSLPERMMWSDCASYLPDDIFVKLDRMSMANSLEARSPFVDHNLIEFLATLPLEYKCRKGQSKILLKNAMRKNYKSIVGRTKHGFEAPVAKWFTGDLNDQFLDMVSSDSSGIVNRPFAERLLKQHTGNRSDNSKKLWPIFVYLNWLSSRR